MEKTQCFDDLSTLPAEITGRIPTIRVVAMPADSNASGDVFGGWLLAQMDISGAAHAYKRLGHRIVTVGIEAMTFHKPVFIGDEVSFYTEISKIGRTSITIKIESWAFRRAGRAYDKVTEGLFTYVQVDDQRKPVPIAQEKK
jgi:acyl-CoA thioesterase YciA